MVPTQEQRVMKYIQDFGSITRLDAMRDVGVANLTAVISDLRKHGVSIETRMIKGKNRYNQVITYARYIFKEDNNAES